MKRIIILLFLFCFALGMLNAQDVFEAYDQIPKGFSTDGTPFNSFKFTLNTTGITTEAFTLHIRSALHDSDDELDHSDLATDDIGASGTPYAVYSVSANDDGTNFWSEVTVTLNTGNFGGTYKVWVSNDDNAIVTEWFFSSEQLSDVITSEAITLAPAQNTAINKLVTNVSSTYGVLSWTLDMTTLPNANIDGYRLKITEGTSTPVYETIVDGSATYGEFNLTGPDAWTYTIDTPKYYAWGTQYKYELVPYIDINGTFVDVNLSTDVIYGIVPFPYHVDNATPDNASYAKEYQATLNFDLTYFAEFDDFTYTLVIYDEESPGSVVDEIPVPDPNTIGASDPLWTVSGTTPNFTLGYKFEQNNYLKWDNEYSWYVKVEEEFDSTDMIVAGESPQQLGQPSFAYTPIFTPADGATTVPATTTTLVWVVDEDNTVDTYKISIARTAPTALTLATDVTIVVGTNATMSVDRTTYEFDLEEIGAFTGFNFGEEWTWTLKGYEDSGAELVFTSTQDFEIAGFLGHATLTLPTDTSTFNKTKDFSLNFTIDKTINLGDYTYTLVVDHGMTNIVTAVINIAALNNENGWTYENPSVSISTDHEFKYVPSVYLPWDSSIEYTWYVKVNEGTSPFTPITGHDEWTFTIDDYTPGLYDVIALTGSTPGFTLAKDAFTVLNWTADLQSTIDHYEISIWYEENSQNFYLTNPTTTHWLAIDTTSGTGNTTYNDVTGVYAFDLTKLPNHNFTYGTEYFWNIRGYENVPTNMLVLPLSAGSEPSITISAFAAFATLTNPINGDFDIPMSEKLTWTITNAVEVYTLLIAHEDATTWTEVTLDFLTNAQEDWLDYTTTPGTYVFDIAEYNKDVANASNKIDLQYGETYIWKVVAGYDKVTKNYFGQGNVLDVQRTFTMEDFPFIAKLANITPDGSGSPYQKSQVTKLEWSIPYFTTEISATAKLNVWYFDAANVEQTLVDDEDVIGVVDGTTKYDFEYDLVGIEAPRYGITYHWDVTTYTGATPHKSAEFTFTMDVFTKDALLGDPGTTPLLTDLVDPDDIEEFTFTLTTPITGLNYYLIFREHTGPGHSKTTWDQVIDIDIHNATPPTFMTGSAPNYVFDIAIYNAGVAPADQISFRKAHHYEWLVTVREAKVATPATKDDYYYVNENLFYTFTTMHGSITAINLAPDSISDEKSAFADLYWEIDAAVDLEDIDEMKLELSVVNADGTTTPVFDSPIIVTQFDTAGLAALPTGLTYEDPATSTSTNHEFTYNISGLYLQYGKEYFWAVTLSYLDSSDPIEDVVEASFEVDPFTDTITAVAPTGAVSLKPLTWSWTNDDTQEATYFFYLSDKADFSTSLLGAGAVNGIEVPTATDAIFTSVGATVTFDLDGYLTANSTVNYYMPWGKEYFWQVVAREIVAEDTNPGEYVYEDLDATAFSFTLATFPYYVTASTEKPEDDNTTGILKSYAKAMEWSINTLHFDGLANLYFYPDMIVDDRPTPGLSGYYPDPSKTANIVKIEASELYFTTGDYTYTLTEELKYGTVYGWQVVPFEMNGTTEVEYRDNAPIFEFKIIDFPYVTSITPVVPAHDPSNTFPKTDFTKIEFEVDEDYVYGTPTNSKTFVSMWTYDALANIVPDAVVHNLEVPVANIAAHATNPTNVFTVPLTTINWNNHYYWQVTLTDDQDITHVDPNIYQFRTGEFSFHAEFVATTNSPTKTGSVYLSNAIAGLDKLTFDIDPATTADGYMLTIYTNDGTSDHPVVAPTSISTLTPTLTGGMNRYEYTIPTTVAELITWGETYYWKVIPYEGTYPAGAVEVTATHVYDFKIAPFTSWADNATTFGATPAHSAVTSLTWEFTSPKTLVNKYHVALWYIDPITTNIVHVLTENGHNYVEKLKGTDTPDNPITLSLSGKYIKASTTYHWTVTPVDDVTGVEITTGMPTAFTFTTQAFSTEVVYGTNPTSYTYDNINTIALNFTLTAPTVDYRLYVSQVNTMDDRFVVVDDVTTLTPVTPGVYAYTFATGKIVPGHTYYWYVLPYEDNNGTPEYLVSETPHQFDVYYPNYAINPIPADGTDMSKTNMDLTFSIYLDSAYAPATNAVLSFVASDTSINFAETAVDENTTAGGYWKTVSHVGDLYTFTYDLKAMLDFMGKEIAEDALHTWTITPASGTAKTFTFTLVAGNEISAPYVINDLLKELGDILDDGDSLIGNDDVYGTTGFLADDTEVPGEFDITYTPTGIVFTETGIGTAGKFSYLRFPKIKEIRTKSFTFDADDPDDKLTIGWFDLVTGNFRPLTITRGETYLLSEVNNNKLAFQFAGDDDATATATLLSFQLSPVAGIINDPIYTHTFDGVYTGTTWEPYENDDINSDFLPLDGWDRWRDVQTYSGDDYYTPADRVAITNHDGYEGTLSIKIQVASFSGAANDWVFPAGLVTPEIDNFNNRSVVFYAKATKAVDMEVHQVSMDYTLNSDGIKEFDTELMFTFDTANPRASQISTTWERYEFTLNRAHYGNSLSDDFNRLMFKVINGGGGVDPLKDPVTVYIDNIAIYDVPLTVDVDPIDGYIETFTTVKADFDENYPVTMPFGWFFGGDLSNDELVSDGNALVSPILAVVPEDGVLQITATKVGDGEDYLNVAIINLDDAYYTNPLNTNDYLVAIEAIRGNLFRSAFYNWGELADHKAEYNTIVDDVDGKTYTFDISAYAGNRVGILVEHMNAGGTNAGIIIDDIKVIASSIPFATLVKPSHLSEGINWQAGLDLEWTAPNATHIPEIYYVRTGSVFDNNDLIGDYDSIVWTKVSPALTAGATTYTIPAGELEAFSMYLWKVEFVDPIAPVRADVEFEYPVWAFYTSFAITNDVVKMFPIGGYIDEFEENPITRDPYVAGTDVPDSFVLMTSKGLDQLLIPYESLTYDVEDNLFIEDSNPSDQTLQVNLLEPNVPFTGAFNTLIFPWIEDLQSKIITFGLNSTDATPNTIVTLTLYGKGMKTWSDWVTTDPYPAEYFIVNNGGLIQLTGPAQINNPIHTVDFTDNVWKTQLNRLIKPNGPYDPQDLFFSITLQETTANVVTLNINNFNVDFARETYTLGTIDFEMSVVPGSNDVSKATLLLDASLLSDDVTVIKPTNLPAGMYWMDPTLRGEFVYGGEEIVALNFKLVASEMDASLLSATPGPATYSTGIELEFVEYGTTHVMGPITINVNTWSDDYYSFSGGTLPADNTIVNLPVWHAVDESESQMIYLGKELGFELPTLITDIAFRMDEDAIATADINIDITLGVTTENAITSWLTSGLTSTTVSVPPITTADVDADGWIPIDLSGAQYIFSPEIDEDNNIISNLVVQVVNKNNATAFDQFYYNTTVAGNRSLLRYENTATPGTWINENLSKVADFRITGFTVPSISEPLGYDFGFTTQYAPKEKGYTISYLGTDDVDLDIDVTMSLDEQIILQWLDGTTWRDILGPTPFTMNPTNSELKIKAYYFPVDVPPVSSTLDVEITVNGSYVLPRFAGLFEGVSRAPVLPPSISTLPYHQNFEVASSVAADFVRMDAFFGLVYDEPMSEIYDEYGNRPDLLSWTEDDPETFVQEGSWIPRYGWKLGNFGNTSSTNMAAQVLVTGYEVDVDGNFVFRPNPQTGEMEMVPEDQSYALRSPLFELTEDTNLYRVGFEIAATARDYTVPSNTQFDANDYLFVYAQAQDDASPWGAPIIVPMAFYTKGGNDTGVSRDLASLGRELVSSYQSFLVDFSKAGVKGNVFGGVGYTDVTFPPAGDEFSIFIVAGRSADVIETLTTELNKYTPFAPGRGNVLNLIKSAENRGGTRFSDPLTVQYHIDNFRFDHKAPDVKNLWAYNTNSVDTDLDPSLNGLYGDENYAVTLTWDQTEVTRGFEGFLIYKDEILLNHFYFDGTTYHQATTSNAPQGATPGDDDHIVLFTAAHFNGAAYPGASFAPLNPLFDTSLIHLNGLPEDLPHGYIDMNVTEGLHLYRVIPVYGGNDYLLGWDTDDLYDAWWSSPGQNLFNPDAATGNELLATVGYHPLLLEVVGIPSEISIGWENPYKFTGTDISFKIYRQIATDILEDVNPFEYLTTVSAQDALAGNITDVNWNSIDGLPYKTYAYNDASAIVGVKYGYYIVAEFIPPLNGGIYGVIEESSPSNRVYAIINGPIFALDSPYLADPIYIDPTDGNPLHYQRTVLPHQSVVFGAVTAPETMVETVTYKIWNAGNDFLKIKDVVMTLGATNIADTLAVKVFYKNEYLAPADYDTPNIISLGNDLTGDYIHVVVYYNTTLDVVDQTMTITFVDDIRQRPNDEEFVVHFENIPATPEVVAALAPKLEENFNYWYLPEIVTNTAAPWYDTNTTLGSFEAAIYETNPWWSRIQGKYNHNADAPLYNEVYVGAAVGYDSSWRDHAGNTTLPTVPGLIPPATQYEATGWHIGSFGNNANQYTQREAAKVRMFGGAEQYNWLVTPVINLPEGNGIYTVEYEFAITNAIAPSVSYALHQSDEFAVLISTLDETDPANPVWSNWEVIRTWIPGGKNNQTGHALLPDYEHLVGNLNDFRTELKKWVTVKLGKPTLADKTKLEPYEGKVKLAFYAARNSDTPQYPQIAYHVDKVTVEFAPPDPTNVHAKINANAGNTVDVTWNVPDNTFTRGLLGYRIFRDAVLLNTCEEMHPGHSCDIIFGNVCREALINETNKTNSVHIILPELGDTSFIFGWNDAGDHMSTNLSLCEPAPCMLALNDPSHVHAADGCENDENGLDFGSYEYYVTAVYDNGESPGATHPETITVGLEAQRFVAIVHPLDPASDINDPQVLSYTENKTTTLYGTDLFWNPPSALSDPRFTVVGYEVLRDGQMIAEFDVDANGYNADFSHYNNSIPYYGIQMFDGDITDKDHPYYDYRTRAYYFFDDNSKWTHEPLIYQETGLSAPTSQIPIGRYVYQIKPIFATDVKVPTLATVNVYPGFDPIPDNERTHAWEYKARLFWDVSPVKAVLDAKGHTPGKVQGVDKINSIDYNLYRFHTHNPLEFCKLTNVAHDTTVAGHNTPSNPCKFCVHDAITIVYPATGGCIDCFELAKAKAECLLADCLNPHEADALHLIQTVNTTFGTTDVLEYEDPEVGQPALDTDAWYQYYVVAAYDMDAYIPVFDDDMEFEDYAPGYNETEYATELVPFEPLEIDELEEPFGLYARVVRNYYSLENMTFRLWTYDDGPHNNPEDFYSIALWWEMAGNQNEHPNPAPAISGSPRENHVFVSIDENGLPRSSSRNAFVTDSRQNSRTSATTITDRRAANKNEVISNDDQNTRAFLGWYVFINNIKAELHQKDPITGDLLDDIYLMPHSDEMFDISYKGDLDKALVVHLDKAGIYSVYISAVYTSGVMSTTTAQTIYAGFEPIVLHSEVVSINDGEHTITWSVPAIVGLGLPQTQVRLAAQDPYIVYRKPDLNGNVVFGEVGRVGSQNATLSPREYKDTAAYNGEYYEYVVVAQYQRPSGWPHGTPTGYIPNWTNPKDPNHPLNWDDYVAQDYISDPFPSYSSPLVLDIQEPYFDGTDEMNWPRPTEQFTVTPRHFMGYNMGFGETKVRGLAFGSDVLRTTSSAFKIRTLAIGQEDDIETVNPNDFSGLGGTPGPLHPTSFGWSFYFTTDKYLTLKPDSNLQATPISATEAMKYDSIEDFFSLGMLNWSYEPKKVDENGDEIKIGDYIILNSSNYAGFYRLFMDIEFAPEKIGSYTEYLNLIFVLPEDRPDGSLGYYLWNGSGPDPSDPDNDLNPDNLPIILSSKLVYKDGNLFGYIGFTVTLTATCSDYRVFMYTDQEDELGNADQSIIESPNYTIKGHKYREDFNKYTVALNDINKDIRGRWYTTATNNIPGTTGTSGAENTHGYLGGEPKFPILEEMLAVPGVGNIFLTPDENPPFKSAEALTTNTPDNHWKPNDFFGSTSNRAVRVQQTASNTSGNHAYLVSPVFVLNNMYRRAENANATTPIANPALIENLVLSFNFAARSGNTMANGNIDNSDVFAIWYRTLDCEDGFTWNPADPAGSSSTDICDHENGVCYGKFTPYKQLVRYDNNSVPTLRAMNNWTATQRARGENQILTFELPTMVNEVQFVFYSGRTAGTGSSVVNYIIDNLMLSEKANLTLAATQNLLAKRSTVDPNSQSDTVITFTWNDFYNPGLAAPYQYRVYKNNGDEIAINSTQVNLTTRTFSDAGAFAGRASSYEVGVVEYADGNYYPVSPRLGYNIVPGILSLSTAKEPVTTYIPTELQQFPGQTFTGDYTTTYTPITRFPLEGYDVKTRGHALNDGDMFVSPTLATGAESTGDGFYIQNGITTGIWVDNSAAKFQTVSGTGATYTLTEVSPRPTTPVNHAKANRMTQYVVEGIFTVPDDYEYGYIDAQRYYVAPGASPIPPQFRMNIAYHTLVERPQALTAYASLVGVQRLEFVGTPIWNAANPTYQVEYTGATNPSTVIMNVTFGTEAAFNRALARMTSYMANPVVDPIIPAPTAYGFDLIGIVVHDYLKPSGLGEVTLLVRDENDVWGYDCLPSEGPISAPETITAENGILIKWTLIYPDDISGFMVFRNDVKDFDTATNITPNMLVTRSDEYSYLDENVEEGKEYFYWVAVYDTRNFDEATWLYGPYSGKFGDDIVVLKTQLTAAYPNPLRGGTNMNFRVDVKEGENATLRIYNIKGQLVKELPVVSAPRGGKGLKDQNLVWNQTDSNNRNVASGVYFYRLSSETTNQIKKMVLVK